VTRHSPLPESRINFQLLAVGFLPPGNQPAFSIARCSCSPPAPRDRLRGRRRLTGASSACPVCSFPGYNLLPLPDSWLPELRWRVLTLKIGMNQSRQDKDQNSQFNINSYYFASLQYMTIVQDMEIVLGYSGYDFINETKMDTKRHQDEVKSWILMHQDEVLVETIETDIWIA
jgi:hypothetical protein